MKPVKQIFTAIFMIGFLVSFSGAIGMYVNSSFLNTYIPENFVGLFYIISSAITILAMLKTNEVFEKIGIFRTTLIVLLIDFLALITLAFLDNALIVSMALIVHLISLTLIFFNIDIFLESFTTNNSTGKIRGSYLSLNNLAILISPAVAGFILSKNEYWKIYLFSAILIIPVIYILIKNFKTFKDPQYNKASINKIFKILLKRKNIAKIFWAQFLLRFFYSWMVIYTPIYLHQYMNFDWGTIGIIFTIMLLPFVLLEIPLGRLADELLGEKEILIIGFMITGVATATLTFITSNSAILWGLLLFITRIGASMIEISSETYFFKKIDGEDINILSSFRITRPLAYILSPMLASILLIFIDINYLFVVLGIGLTIGGIAVETTLKDTK